MLMGYQLYIANQKVLDTASPAAATPRVVLSHLARSFDGPAELGFAVLNAWRNPAWSADSDVRLERDGRVLFRGLLDLPSSQATLGGARLNFTARDRSNIQRPAVATTGFTAIRLTPATLGNTGTQLLNHIAATLTAIGLQPTFAFSGGAEAIQVLQVDLANKTIAEAIRMVAEAAPGVRVFLDPAGEDGDQWRFVAVYNSPRVVIQIDVDRLPEFSIERSLEGRCGAVRTNSRQATAQNNVTIKTQLAAAWNTSLQSRWTIDRARSSTDASGAPSEMSKVYRVWSFAAFASAVSAEFEIEALILKQGYIPEEFQTIEIESIDWDAKTVTLVQPAVKMPHYRRCAGGRFYSVPGKATPADVWLRYTNNTQGSTTLPGERFPQSGFAGRAVALAPITMAFEKQIEVPAGVPMAAYAADAFRALSEPLVEGSVTLLGDLPDAVLDLAARVCFATASLGPTGYETLDAPVFGYRITFNERGPSSEIQFSSSKELMIRKGVG